jgi:RNA polymerase sigma factor (sigma-70 family)
MNLTKVTAEYIERLKASQREFDFFALKNIKYIQKIAHKILLKRGTISDIDFMEDLIQVGMIALWAKAIPAWDSNRGVTFSTFAHKVLYNEMLQASMKNDKLSKKIGFIQSIEQFNRKMNDSSGTNEVNEYIETSWKNRNSSFEEDVINKIDEDSKLSGLSDRDRTIYVLQKQGKKRTEIFKHAGFNNIHTYKHYLYNVYIPKMKKMEILQYV